MWVDRTPAMSAATDDTRVSSSYHALSIGSRDSANAATAAATNSCARSAGAAPLAAMRRAPMISPGSNRFLAARKASMRLPQIAGRRSAASAVASIEVNTRNGLRASSSASIGRNAVETTGTGDSASRRS